MSPEACRLVSLVRQGGDVLEPLNVLDERAVISVCIEALSFMSEKSRQQINNEPGWQDE